MDIFLKEVLEEKGLTIKSIADKTGIAPESINRIANGVNTNPKIETLQSLAVAIGVSLSRLVEKPKLKNEHQFTCPNCGKELEIKEKEQP